MFKILIVAYIGKYTSEKAIAMQVLEYESRERAETAVSIILGAPRLSDILEVVKLY